MFSFGRNKIVTPDESTKVVLPSDLKNNTNPKPNPINNESPVMNNTPNYREKSLKTMLSTISEYNIQIIKCEIKLVKSNTIMENIKALYDLPKLNNTNEAFEHISKMYTYINDYIDSIIVECHPNMGVQQNQVIKMSSLPFVYKMMVIYICFIIVTNPNIKVTIINPVWSSIQSIGFRSTFDKNKSSTIPPVEQWRFILPLIVDEMNKQTDSVQKSEINRFIQNNSMSKIFTLQYPGKTIQQDIQLVNDTIFTLITEINTKLQRLGKNDPKYTPLVSLKQKIQNECNALRQMLEYNLIRTNSEEIATNLVYFASDYFGPNKEIYQQTNTPFSKAYLNTLLDTRIKGEGQTNFYLFSMSDKIATLTTMEDVHKDEVNDTESPKIIFTPTTKTTITKDNKNKDISTCLAADMFPPDGQFAPIAKLMKAKAKSLNLEKEAKQMYDQILVDRSKCKATVNRLYSTTLSSMNATKWDKLGGRRTRRHLKQKKQKKAKKTQKFKTRKQRKTKK